MSASQEVESLFPDVSRETWERLQTMVALLLKWQKVINLVSASTLPQVWTRHIADSLQLVSLAPAGTRTWIDLGSGGGFPGLVVAAALTDRDATTVPLVESDARKCGFLREAARAMAVPAVIHNDRAEAVIGEWAGKADVVSARALASTDKLLDLAAPFISAGAIALFPKGQDLERELTEARERWNINYELAPSVSDPRSRVLVITGAEPKSVSTSRRSRNG